MSKTLRPRTLNAKRRREQRTGNQAKQKLVVLKWTASMNIQNQN
jgi:hypothetical protein